MSDDLLVTKATGSCTASETVSVQEDRRLTTDVAQMPGEDLPGEASVRFFESNDVVSGVIAVVGLRRLRGHEGMRSTRPRRLAGARAFSGAWHVKGSVTERPTISSRCARKRRTARLAAYSRTWSRNEMVPGSLAGRTCRTPAAPTRWARAVDGGGPSALARGPHRLYRGREVLRAGAAAAADDGGAGVDEGLREGGELAGALGEPLPTPGDGVPRLARVR